MMLVFIRLTASRRHCGREYPTARERKRIQLRLVEIFALCCPVNPTCQRFQRADNSPSRQKGLIQQQSGKLSVAKRGDSNRALTLPK